MDIADEAQAKAVVKEAVKQFGRIDVLVILGDVFTRGNTLNLVWKQRK